MYQVQPAGGGGSIWGGLRLCTGFRLLFILSRHQSISLDNWFLVYYTYICIIHLEGIYKYV